MSTITKHLVIKGSVQGVGYRYSMCDQAIQLNVKGWVKNRADGSVEAMVQGAEDAVNKIIEWSKKGPDFSNVDNVDVSEGSGQFQEFEISY